MTKSLTFAFSVLAFGAVANIGHDARANTPSGVVPFPTPRSVAVEAVHRAASQAQTRETILTAIPRAKPAGSISQTTRNTNPSVAGDIGSPDALRRFFRLLERKDAVGALRAKNAMPVSLDRQIASFMIATSGIDDFRYETLRKSTGEVSGWPGGSAMRLRQEQAIVREEIVDRTRLNTLGKNPTTSDGRLFLIRGLLKTGQRDKAAQTLRGYWVSGIFGANDQKKILAEFPGLLRSTDHAKRLNQLLYDEKAKLARPLVRFLPKAEQSLANARIAVTTRSANAQRLLEAVPERLQSDPAYFYAVVQHLRRQDKWLKAAEVLKAAPRDQKVLTDPDAWWTERRLVSRKVREAGHPRLAYELASNHAAKSAVRKIDAEFHAGWYALRFMKSPQKALPHFQKVNELATRSLSKSRALYWLARTYEQNGQNNDARVFYKQASNFSHTYYGQLALQKMGQSSIALKALPETSSSINAFNSKPMVRVLNRLHQIGQSGRTGIFYRHLARSLKSAPKLTLLAQSAEKQGMYTEALQVGKIALSRGFDVPRLAFPLGAISNTRTISKKDRALAYAISRQESAFDIGAVSRADARGLMQLLPSTAKITARKLGIPFQAAKLTRDGAYNARLGSSFLNEQIERFGGSYILAFAAYNAGPRRSEQWIQRFGDPRKNAVDAVDWVEKIPFSETRNYVQRVMENFQIYRYRLENSPLTITQDLNRGLPS